MTILRTVSDSFGELTVPAEEDREKLVSLDGFRKK